MSESFAAWNSPQSSLRDEHVISIEEDEVWIPRGPFMLKWNKIFLLSCFLALAIDSLCFYIPLINPRDTGNPSKLGLDKRIEKLVIVLRSSNDLLYVAHIFIEFHTGVSGQVNLCKDHAAFATRYIFSHYLTDIVPLLPLPQVFFLVIFPKALKHSKSSLVHALECFIPFVVFQNLVRLVRVYRLYKEVMKTSGRIIERAWSGAAFNLFLYTIYSHIVGALWYTLASRDVVKGYRYIDTGIYHDALQVMAKPMSFGKLLYCFWFGLKNISSLAQGLDTYPKTGENLFAVFICISGLILFALLIGDMQRYLQSHTGHTLRVEELRLRRQDTEQWMSHRRLRKDLRERIRRHEHYKWQETRGVGEECLIRTFPKDIRRDIKRHLCVELLKKVPILHAMDENLLDAICERLKPVLYTEKSIILCEGYPIDEMLFILRGHLTATIANKSVVSLKSGNFCGEEVLPWALNPHSSSNILPISSWTIQTSTDVQGFALSTDDLKFVASQYQELHSRKVRHIFRYLSVHWRNWAAGYIQAAWRKYLRLKARGILA